MTKNILVVDEHGNEYGTTYPKRAKRLVKQGRARFLTQNTLCLACPPKYILEDNDMSEQMIENQQTADQIIEIPTAENDTIKNPATDDFTAENPATVFRTPENDVTEDKYSINYCLGQIEQIAKQTDYLNQTIAELHAIEADSGNAGETKAGALCRIVECRETTNQQLLRFYEKMYDDLKNNVSKTDGIKQKAQLQEQLLKVLDKSIENCDYATTDLKDLFNGAFDAIRHVDD